MIICQILKTNCSLIKIKNIINITLWHLKSNNKYIDVFMLTDIDSEKC